MLEALWELLLQAILQALGANRDVSADFYGRFHFTLEVEPHGSLSCLNSWFLAPLPPPPGNKTADPFSCMLPSSLVPSPDTPPLGSHQAASFSLSLLSQQHLGHLF